MLGTTGLHSIHVADTAYSEKQHCVISYFQFPRC